MAEKFDFEAALEAVQSGQSITGKDGVIECILKHLSVWDPQPRTPSPAGLDPPWPKGGTIPVACHPGADIA